MNETSPTRIVVGIDHSEAALHAFDFAVGEAVLRGAELEVLWAWSDHPPRSDPSTGPGDVDLELSAHRQLADVVADRMPDGLDVTLRAVIGSPASALLTSARSAGLLVVGARGAGGFLGLRLGSVSLKVAGSAPCPVVVVHPTIDRPDVNTEPRIVVGVDGAESARDALRWALREAAVRELPVVVVHGWMVPTVAASYPGTASPLAAIGDAAGQLLDTELEWAAAVAPDVTVRAQPVFASGASALVDESPGASMVVVGSRGQGGLTRLLLGSVAQQVLRHAECPVVVMPQR